MTGETLYEYWERFNKLCASCPQQQISEQLLIQYFYEGFLPNDRSIVDAASGGALVNKTPAQARELINNMAQNTQQFGTRESQVRQVNEIKGESFVDAQIANLTSILNRIIPLVAQHSVHAINPQPIKYGICCLEGHPTDQCPTLQECAINAINPNQPRRYDPYSNTYNEG